MPKREDERERGLKASNLRYCVKCKKWFKLEDWNYHYHNPEALARVDRMLRLHIINRRGEHNVQPLQEDKKGIIQ